MMSDNDSDKHLQREFEEMMTELKKLPSAELKELLLSKIAELDQNQVATAAIAAEMAKRGPATVSLEEAIKIRVATEEAEASRAMLLAQVESLQKLADPEKGID
jgi:DNA invertase Pin-like site-specific DNA recombinase